MEKEFRSRVTISVSDGAEHVIPTVNAVKKYVDAQFKIKRKIDTALMILLVLDMIVGVAVIVARIFYGV